MGYLDMAILTTKRQLYAGVLCLVQDPWPRLEPQGSRTSTPDAVVQTSVIVEQTGKRKMDLGLCDLERQQVDPSLSIKDSKM